MHILANRQKFDTWITRITCALHRCVGVCESRKSDVRALSRLRPETETDHSEEERRHRGTVYGHDAARLAPQRRRRSAVRAHGQLHSSVLHRGRRDLQLHCD